MSKQNCMQRCIHIAKRFMRHSWYDISDTRRAIPKAVQLQLKEKIALSERTHSGQIRLCVEAALPLGYIWRSLSSRARAVMLFGKLRVWDTERNNGVLIYVLLAERKIEIVADRGLSNHVDAKVWQSLVAKMQNEFKAERFAAGLALAIDEVSRHLAAYFPDNQPHKNELPDTPVLQ